MLHHVVLFRWKDGVPDGYAETARDDLMRYAATLTGVVSYHCGPNAGHTDGAADFGITAVFDDVAAWHRYDTDDEHNRIRREVFAPWVETRTVIQFES